MLPAGIRRTPACSLALALVVAVLGIVACSGDPADSTARPGRWQPKPTTKPWQFQLQGRIDPSVEAPVYEVDGFNVTKETVDALHARGRKVICYIDVGSWENYRPDAKRFPRSVIGRAYEGYPDERWLDIRRYRKFAGPIRSRIRMCARKGFDGLEPDNVNGWENPTGFPLTARHQLGFNRWIARLAHANGLAVGLKNDGRQARKLVRDFDFAVVEQCFQYGECGLYSPFVERGKAVYAVEYELPKSAFCGRAAKLGFSAVGKKYALFARPFRPCSAE
jgi:hypothetical protein